MLHTVQIHNNWNLTTGMFAQSHTQMSISNSTELLPLTAQYDALYTLDVFGRYAVQRCGADDNIASAIMSALCVLPAIVWVATLILSFALKSLYFYLNRCTLPLLTALQMILGMAFYTPPPVLGCSLSHSFPCLQVSLCSYITVTLLCYSRGVSPRSSTIRWMAIGMYILTVHSVLRIGAASAPGCAAGAVLGANVGGWFHQLLIYMSGNKSQQLHRIAFIIGWYGGVEEIDQVQSVATTPPTYKVQHDPVVPSKVALEYRKCSATGFDLGYKV